MLAVTVVSVLSYMLFLLSSCQYFGILKPTIPVKLIFVLFRLSAITSFFLSYLLIIGLLLQLTTKVTSQGLFYKLKPFILKERFVSADKIEKFELLNDASLKDFGGFNLRSGFGRMRNIYTIAGSRGVKIILEDGSKIILGSQKPEMLARGLEKMKMLS